MIKLVATDIDGTVIIPEHDFTENVKQCINKLNQAGIKVVLVTGRMHSSAKLIAERLGLKTPIVSYQGGLIKHDDMILYEKYISENQAEKIINWAKNEQIHLNLYQDDVLYSEKDCYEVQRYSKNLKVDFCTKPFSAIKKTNINKILAIDYNSPERIEKLEREVPTIFPDLYIVKSTPYFLEFSNKEASKYCAVKFLQKYWNLKDEEILTIGDQNNDIALLEAGGVKIAMGNATNKLKSIADDITASVDNDGFVKAMEKYCKI